MFKVNANSILEYFNSDPSRKSDLEAIDGFIRSSAPELKRWFYDGINKDTGGMRMQLIGYGSFSYSNPKGILVNWPIIGLSLQKNYISLYISGLKENKPILDMYRGKLGEVRSGHNNFSFKFFRELNQSSLRLLLKDISNIVRNNSKQVLRDH